MKTNFKELLKACVPWRLKLWIKARNNREIATPTDLKYCYRLILGRDPDPDGWQTYLASIRHGAMTRSRLTQNFLNSVEFGMRRVALDAEGRTPIAVELPDYVIYLRNPELAIGHAILHDRCYEPDVTTMLKQILMPGMNFIDIGCNIGYFSLLAAKYVGQNGMVYAYDPSQANCALLRRSATENSFKNIDVRCHALADSIKRYVYVERNGNGVLDVLSDNIPRVEDSVVVTTVVLDEEMSDAHHVDVIKIDVEGAEHLVMLGAKTLLTKHRPIVLSEFSPKALEQVSRISPKEYLEYMLGFGYRIFALAPSSPPIALRTSNAVLDYQKKRKVDHIDLMFTAEQSLAGD